MSIPLPSHHITLPRRVKKLLLTLLALPGLVSTFAQAGPARDPWRQPYLASSIWNTPLGDAPTLVNVATNGLGYLSADVTYIYFSNPGDPLVHVYIPTVNINAVNVNLPTDFLSDLSYGNTPNNPAFIAGGSLNGVELQPFKRTTVGGSVSAYNASRNGSNYFSLLGAGDFGAHFGSQLPSEGGCLRPGELTGSGNIQHALQFELPTYLLYKNTAVTTNRNETYIWPANTSDNNISDYGTQNKTNSYLRMGSLLTIQPGVTAASLGLTSPPALKIFWTLQHYGAYIVDTSATSGYKPNGKDAFNIGIEAGAKQEFIDAFGLQFPQSSTSTNVWITDMKAIYTHLAVVADNAADNVGGAGNRLDTPIADLAYGVRKTVVNGTQIEAEDYNVGGQGVGYNDTGVTNLGQALWSGPYDFDGAGGAYRNDGVDIYQTTDPDSGAPGYFEVGSTAPGEWLKYDITVPTAGYYTITVRGACGTVGGGQLHFNDGATNLTGTITLPYLVNQSTGAALPENVTSVAFYLAAGSHTLQLAEDTGGYSVNYFTIRNANQATFNTVPASVQVGTPLVFTANYIASGPSRVSAEIYDGNYAFVGSTNVYVSAAGAGTKTLTCNVPSTAVTGTGHIYLKLLKDDFSVTYSQVTRNITITP